MKQFSTDISRRLDIIARKNATFQKDIAVKNEDASNFDFTGYVVELQVFQSLADDVPTLVFNAADGLTLTAGNIALFKSAAKMYLRRNDYIYYLWVTYPDATKRLWLNGSFIVNEGFFDGVDETDSLTITTQGETVTIILESVSSGGPVVEPTYDGATPSNIAVGAIPSGYDPTGKTALELWEAAFITYLTPLFTAFSISGQAATVELGTTISGTKTFLWSTSNPSNIAANSISIQDVTNAVVLASGLANDGTQDIAINVVRTTAGSVTWRITLTDSNAVNHTRDFVVTWSPKRFYGVGSIPVNSAQVRALAGNTFGNTFSIVIAAGQTQIAFSYEASRPDISNSSVLYVEGFNAPVGNTFTKSTFNVQDAGGNNVSTKVYTVTLGAPNLATATYNVTIP